MKLPAAGLLRENIIGQVHVAVIGRDDVPRSVQQRRHFGTGNGDLAAPQVPVGENVGKIENVFFFAKTGPAGR